MTRVGLRLRSRRTRLIALGVTVTLVGTILAVLWFPNRNPGLGLAGMAVVTASSTALGSLPRNVAVPGSATPAENWVSKEETTGAWIQLEWSQMYTLHRVVLERNVLNEPGITDGFLSFGDGSFLQVKLSTTSPTTVIPITPRLVDRVRFTVSAVSQGARDVSVAEFAVSDEPDDGDVVSDATPDGNIAPRALATQDGKSGASDPRALQDGSPATTGDAWSVSQPVGSWGHFAWNEPRELSSIELVGSPNFSATIRSGSITFSDGSRLAVGAVLSDPDHPTIVSFMPRVTSSLRLTVDSVNGTGPLALAELRVYQRGATPQRSPVKPGPGDRERSPGCGRSATATMAVGVVIQCPVSGSAVGDKVEVRLSMARGYSSIHAVAWPADPSALSGPPVSAVPGSDGPAKLILDLRSLPSGPLTVRFEARGPRRPAKTVFFQLYRPGSDTGDVSSADQSRGRTLAYAEEFNHPISLSRTGEGADYAAAKPASNGVEDFGFAIFADPERFDNIRVVDNRYLRINVEPVPPGYADPQGWGRTRLGGMLASARPGGSGFSAQYGYFEARMLAPAAAGTWPAFWMLPSPNLVEPQPVVAEIDAVELYGHDPTAACHTTHEYRQGKHGGGIARCGQRHDTTRSALSWHTYAVSVSPVEVTFFIDGRQVASAPQVGGGVDPMFFLVDLALGGGWPIKMESVQDRAELYVDFVRVYV